MCARSPAQLAAIAAGQPVSPCADGFYICHADGSTQTREWQSVALGMACVEGLYVGLACKCLLCFAAIVLAK